MIEIEARRTIVAARQEAYANSPEGQAEKAARIAAGLCVTEAETIGQPWVRRCVTHDCPDSMAHHFEMNPNASTD